MSRRLAWILAFLGLCGAGAPAVASPSPSGFLLVSFTDGGEDAATLRAALPGLLLVERPKLGIDERPRRGAANVLSEAAGGAKPEVPVPGNADGSIFFQAPGSLLGDFPLPSEVGKEP